MAISDYQIRTVIKTYMKLMKGKIVDPDEDYGNVTDTDEVAISSDAAKRMIYDRIEKHVTEKLKRRGPLR